MKILLVGATGRLGAAVGEALTGRGHQVVTVGRTAGDLRADVADPEQTPASSRRSATSMRSPVLRATSRTSASPT
jgi:uncharacterized protein YbjT (DUF2867 family)